MYRYNTQAYEIRRELFVWLGMLPFVWGNNMTYYEREAFAASAHDFLNNLMRF